MSRIHRKFSTGIFLACACALFAPLATAQEPRAEIFESMRRHLDPSFLSLRETSLNLPGSHLAHDTAAYSVEADIAPHFTLFQAAFDGPLAGAYMLNVGGHFVIRRADGVPSNPVRTPSYIPSVTLFYSPPDPARAGNSQRYVSATLSHYSNGESGDFLRPDGTVNDVDGSFSLWSAAAAFHLINDWPLLPEYKALRIEYLYLKENALDALYPDFILSLALHSADYRHANSGGWGGRARLFMDLDWRVPQGNHRPAALKPMPLSLTVTGAYTPEWGSRNAFPDLWLFSRFYAGSDYYNIQFNREIYRIDAGLMLGL